METVLTASSYFIFGMISYLIFYFTSQQIKFKQEIAPKILWNMITMVYIFSVLIYLIYDFIIIISSQLCDKERNLIFLEIFYRNPFEYHFNYYQVILLIVIGIIVGVISVLVTSPNRFVKGSLFGKISELFFSAGDYPFYDLDYYTTVLLYDMDQQIIYYGDLKYLSNTGSQHEVCMDECVVFMDNKDFNKVINDFKSNELIRDESIDTITFNVSKKGTLWMYERENNG